MAETTTRQLPAPFIEALGKTYADQLTKQVGKPVDTSKSVSYTHLTLPTKA